MVNVIVILLALAGYSLLNLGQAIQKFGLGLKKDGLLKKWSIWFIGTTGTFIAVLLIMAALSLGNVSLVSPMAGSGLIILTLFSHYFLKEKIHKTDIWGVMLIVTGSIVVGLLSGHKEKEHVDHFLIILFPSILIVTFITSWLIGKKTSFKAIIAGGSAGMVAGLGVIFQKALLINTEVTIISTENLSLLLYNPYTYFWIAATLFSFILLQFAYKAGSAIQIIPSFNVTLILIPIIGGTVIFKERVTLLQWLFILIILCGVYLLTGKQKTSSAI
jgi:drug/metabolite transporter (DMT)-like permease